MLKRMLMLGMVVAIGGGLSACVVEDDTPDGGGGGTVIDRERVIERESAPDTDIHVNPPANRTDIDVVPPADSETKVKTEHRTTTTTD